MAVGPPRYALAFTWYFKMVDATDGFTPEPGKVPVVTLSQDGAAFAGLTGAPAVTELSDGWYYITAPIADLSWETGIFKATAAGCADLTERFLIDRAAQIHNARIANLTEFDFVLGDYIMYAADGVTVVATSRVSQAGDKVKLTPQ